MQIPYDFSNELIQDFFAQVPENKRLPVLSELIKNYLTKKTTPVNEPLLDLPFEPLNRTKNLVTNDFINHLREEEGI